MRSASAPSHPSRPRPLLSGVLGVFLGLLLGAAAALVLELVDRRLKDEEAVEEVFAAPILASIPRPPRRRPGMPGDDPNQREAYGMLAANLRFSTLSAEAGTLIVTSPSPAEGKTTVTLGLARSLALLGQRVIAIEADLRRPAFSRYANLDGQQGGLNAVLSGGSKLGEELVWLDAADFRPVTLDGLKEGLSFALLPVGGATPMNPQRALSLPAMGELIEEARALADVVVIDTAPIGTVNDAATLVSRVDATVVVSRLNRTTRDAARRTRRLLANLGIPLAGVVITDTALSTDGYYYDGRAPKEAAEARADARASS